MQGDPSLDTGPAGGMSWASGARGGDDGPSFPAVLRVAAGGDEDAFGMLWYDLQSRLLRYFKVIAAGAAEDLA